MRLTVSPAYGRDYKSLKAAQADYDAGKDFRGETYGHPSCGRYVNKPQLAHEEVWVRYNKMTKIGRLK